MPEASTSSSANDGPLSYENWRAVLAGRPSAGAYEHTLFTDAHITGQISDGLGPYQLLNSVPLPGIQRLAPALVLRLENHLESQSPVPAMKKTDFARYHGGTLADEIAAVVSLCLGVRLRAGGCTRRFKPGQDPRGRPMALETHTDPMLARPSSPSPILPEALGQHNLALASMLTILPCVDAGNAVALVRAARLYQDAVWTVESAPELAWLMLVSAVETAATRWSAAKASPVERLRAALPDLEQVLLRAGGEQLVSEVAPLVADFMGSSKKFQDFTIAFMPDPPSRRPPQEAQVLWETDELRRSLQVIYTWRSRALHYGTPFPLPMCMPPMRLEKDFLEERPLGLATAARNAVWVTDDTPMLFHTFEYIVRNALLKWWGHMPRNASA